MSKRLFDIFFSFLLIILLSWLILLLFLVSSLNLKTFGFFYQERIGQYGKPFVIIKIKTIKNNQDINELGQFLRKYKLDELPQLLNILKGDMSFVGPRPDTAGYYDKLEGENRKILELKPGLTSEASIKYKNEEKLLKKQNNPKKYNDTVLFPNKIKMNLEYYNSRNLFVDLQIIYKTIVSIFNRK